MFAEPDSDASSLQPVILDVDTGVDDALALLYVLASPDAELLAVLSTSGNVPARQVAVNNLALLELCGVEVEVALGAEQPLLNPLVRATSHGPRGLGYAELPVPRTQLSARHACDLLVEEATRRPGEIVLVVTGPLTTLALAVRLESELPRLLRRLVVMGGAFGRPGNTTPRAEWNIHFDPEAAKIVFDAFSGVVICPLDVTETVAMRPEDLERLAAVAGSENPVVRVITDAVRFHMEAYERDGYGYLSHLHDPLAAAVALEPGLAETRSATVDVELAGTLTRGATVADWRGDWSRAPNAEIVVRVDPDTFVDRVVQRLAELARQVAARA